MVRVVWGDTWHECRDDAAWDYAGLGPACKQDWHAHAKCHEAFPSFCQYKSQCLKSKRTLLLWTGMQDSPRRWAAQSLPAATRNHARLALSQPLTHCDHLWSRPPRPWDSMALASPHQETRILEPAALQTHGAEIGAALKCPETLAVAAAPVQEWQKFIASDTPNIRGKLDRLFACKSIAPRKGISNPKSEKKTQQRKYQKQKIIGPWRRWAEKVGGSVSHIYIYSKPWKE